MTELRKLARKKGIHYRDIAEHFGIKRHNVHFAASHKKGRYKQIKAWLNTFDDVDPTLIYKACTELDIHQTELCRRCGLHENRISKILTGQNVFYRWIQDRVLQELYEFQNSV